MSNSNAMFFARGSEGLSQRSARTTLLWSLMLPLFLSACFQSKEGHVDQRPSSGSATDHNGSAKNNKDSAPSNYEVDDGYQKGKKKKTRTEIGEISVKQLPPEAQDVLKKIQSKTPFELKKDGSVFGNREGILPAQARGYYQEYTVMTPGVDHRGARRIISGKGEKNDAATSGEYFYTSDHYRSFKKISLN